MLLILQELTTLVRMLMESPIRKSDVDILVIMETDIPRHKRPVAINRALFGAGDPKRYPCLHTCRDRRLERCARGICHAGHKEGGSDI